MAYLTINNTNKLCQTPHIDAELHFHEVHSSKDTYEFYFTLRSTDAKYKLVIDRETNMTDWWGSFYSNDVRRTVQAKPTHMLINEHRICSITAFVEALKSHISDYHTFP